MPAAVYSGRDGDRVKQEKKKTRNENVGKKRNVMNGKDGKSISALKDGVAVIIPPLFP